MTDRDVLAKYLRGAAIRARETGQLQEFSLAFLVDLTEAGVVLELPANGRDPELLSARQCERYADQLQPKQVPSHG